MWQISESVSRDMLVVAQKQKNTPKNCKCLGMLVVGVAFWTANYTFIFAECGKD